MNTQMTAYLVQARAFHYHQKQLEGDLSIFQARARFAKIGAWTRLFGGGRGGYGEILGARQPAPGAGLSCPIGRIKYKTTLPGIMPFRGQGWAKPAGLSVGLATKPFSFESTVSSSFSSSPLDWILKLVLDLFGTRVLLAGVCGERVSRMRLAKKAQRILPRRLLRRSHDSAAGASHPLASTFFTMFERALHASLLLLEMSTANGVYGLLFTSHIRSARYCSIRSQFPHHVFAYCTHCLLLYSLLLSSPPPLCELSL